MKTHLKEVRESKGISQEELAEHCGVSQSVINRIETDAKSTPYTLFVVIADFLHCSLDEIVGR